MPTTSTPLCFRARAKSIFELSRWIKLFRGPQNLFLPLWKFLKIIKKVRRLKPRIWLMIIRKGSKRHIKKLIRILLQRKKLIGWWFQALGIKRNSLSTKKTNHTLSFQPTEKWIWKTKVFCRMSSSRFQSPLVNWFRLFRNSSSLKSLELLSFPRWLLHRKRKHILRSKDTLKMQLLMN
jgi:hypothetical protein